MAGATLSPCSNKLCINSPSLTNSNWCDRILRQACTASSGRRQRLMNCSCSTFTSSSTANMLLSSLHASRLRVCPLDHNQHQQRRLQQQGVVPAAYWRTGDSSRSNSIGSRSAVCCHSISNGTSRASGSMLNSSQAALDSRQPYYSEPLQQQQQQQQQRQVQQQWEQQNTANAPRGANSRLLQQRQAQAMRRDQQQQQQQRQQQWPSGQQDGEEGFIVPRPRFVSQAHSPYNRGQHWYTAGQYQDPAALHAAILDRCGRGQLETTALRHLIRMADSKRDAQLALSALQAVRSVAVARGYLAPWPDSFLKAFVRMTATCDAHEVLVSAMQRPNELGLVFKWKSLLVALKHWGDASAVDSVQAVVFALEGAGIRPDYRAAYVLVRAYINAGQLELVPAALAWFKQRGVMRFKPAMLNLMKSAGLAVAEEYAAAASIDSSDDESSDGAAARW